MNTESRIGRLVALAAVMLRVQQDNTKEDYDDVSDAPFTISVEPCEGDIDGDGVIGFSDVLAVLAAWGPCGS